MNGGLQFCSPSLNTSAMNGKEVGHHEGPREPCRFFPAKDNTVAFLFFEGATRWRSSGVSLQTVQGRRLLTPGSHFQAPTSKGRSRAIFPPSKCWTGLSISYWTPKTPNGNSPDGWSRKGLKNLGGGAVILHSRAASSASLLAWEWFKVQDGNGWQPLTKAHVG